MLKSFQVKMKSERGVAGLNILLSVVVLIFIVGLVVMIFSLMGGELRQASLDDVTSITVTNETGGWLNSTGYTVDGSTAENFASLVVTAMWNYTSGLSIATANATVTTDTITNATAESWDDVSLSYTYTYSADNTATRTMTDTTSALAGVSDWFPIVIIITAMVVLILLSVIIVSAVRNSGLIASA